MKKLRNLFSVLLLALFAISCTSGTSETEEQMLTAAKELDTKFVEAYTKGDAAGVMATYWNSPELVSYPPDGMGAMGYDKAKEDINKSIEMMKGAKLDLSKINNKVMGEYVLGYGEWTLTLPDSAGTQITGRYTDIKAKKDGKWVYIMDHASVPMPPPGQ